MTIKERHPTAEPTEALPSEAIDALQRGNKIEAIKLVREAQKLDLKEAKDKVDAYVKNDPALKQKLATAHGNGCVMQLYFSDLHSP